MLVPAFRFPDKVRGIFNEGGFFAERSGWHLPSFIPRFTNDETYGAIAWDKRAPDEGLPFGTKFIAPGGDKVLSNGTSGVGFFWTAFELNTPTGYDAMMSFEFVDPPEVEYPPYRALLFVNGWMMGRRVGNLGYVLQARALYLMLMCSNIGRSGSSQFMKVF